ncbi:MAG TPA: hypothetical protein PLN49_13615, partial [Ferruginibacter sp.]|nr:hypothetical protein [Ferruginibacter sp.]
PRPTGVFYTLLPAPPQHYRGTILPLVLPATKFVARISILKSLTQKNRVVRCVSFCVGKIRKGFTWHKKYGRDFQSVSRCRV